MGIVYSQMRPVVPRSRRADFAVGLYLVWVRNSGQSDAELVKQNQLATSVGICGVGLG